MAKSQRSKISMLLFLLSLSCYCISFSIVICAADDVPSEKSDDHVLSAHRYQSQIDRLEKLVHTLGEIVSKLESRLEESAKAGDLNDHCLNGIEKGELGIHGSPSSYKEVNGEVGLKGKVIKETGARVRPGSVTKYRAFWSERFQLVSAVNLESEATCIDVLPFRDFEGLSKYVAVGDNGGRVFVFLRNGEVMAELKTSSDSPITAMLSYFSVFKNDSFLVTGHSDGSILVHKVWESAAGEEWSSVHVESLMALDSVEVGVDGSPVTILELHHAGRARYILSADGKGKIKVFRENGTLYGSAMPMSRPLAFLKQRLLFLTETGAGSLDLRTMKIREAECEGMNHTLAKNYVFDSTERSRAYGFTSAGDLIHVLLLGDVMNFKCRVRSRKKFEMDEPLSFQGIKGYLLIIGQESVYVYNVSSQHYVRSGSPRLIFTASIEEIKSSFLAFDEKDDDRLRKKLIPLVASDHERLVVVGLGGGCVGMYRSKLPVAKAETSTMLWTSPILFFILFLFGAWQFFAKKKEALTSWGPDDPLIASTSTTSEAPLGSASKNRSFADMSSIGADIMDLRSNNLRASSRRYGSPSRYSSATANSRKPTSLETSCSRPSADASFRTASELKFRGSNLDSAGFQERRDNIYVNDQVMGESS